MGDYVCRFAKPYQQERTDFSKDCLYTVKFTDIYGGSNYGNYSKSVIGKTVYKQFLESNLWSFEVQENYDKRNDNTIDIYRGGDYILSYKKDNVKCGWNTFFRGTRSEPIAVWRRDASSVRQVHCSQR